MERIKIECPSKKIEGKINISGSKSISNRILLIRALCHDNFEINNLSNSDDTQTLLSLLNQDGEVYDAHHAGTTFRFLTAYFSIKGDTQVLTGSQRMQQRPIGPLVDALRALGARIDYVANEGYPPLRIYPFGGQQSKVLEIKADISSQFISALCMIAPVLEHGLEIKLIGPLVSKPYLDMTIQMMGEMGINIDMNNDTIKISNGAYVSKDYEVESDWSSASYFYSIAALSESCKLELPHFFLPSMQGDSAIAEMTKALGVSTTFGDKSIILKNESEQSRLYAYDFIKQPDLLQTISVICAAKKIHAQYSGLKTLAIKETDRVAAMQKELSKIGITLRESHESNFEIEQYGECKVDNPIFDTYQDHRMAMSLAPLSMIAPVYINNPKVVSKSYPNFWSDLESLGFLITKVDTA